MEFEQFLDLELDGLARYARTISGDRDRAHDLLAESMIKVQKAWPQVSAANNPVAYVRRIITNTLVSERRSWFARNVFVTNSGELPDRPIGDHADLLEDWDELDRLLRALPPRQRVAIALRYYLDLSDEQIADEMQCSISSVRSYISRGLAGLRVRRHDIDQQEDSHGRG